MSDSAYTVRVAGAVFELTFIADSHAVSYFAVQRAERRPETGAYCFANITVIRNERAFFDAVLSLFDIAAIFYAETVIISVDSALFVYKRQRRNGRDAGKPVTRFDDELFRLLDDMKDTLKDAEGAGLAAPQVGVPVRAVQVDVEEGFFEFINPVIVSQKGEQSGPEGCLSVRGKAGVVVRPEKVKIVFQDRRGDKYSLVARGFFARAVCHELDHLDGVLYTDKATDVYDVDD